MDENEILRCRVDDNVWKCPIDGCEKSLSRKQTLISHLLSQHQLQAGQPSKRYKLYETDSSVPLPRTTRFNKQKAGGNLGNYNSQPGSSTEDENVSIPFLLEQASDDETSLSNVTDEEDDFTEQLMDIEDISSEEDEVDNQDHDTGSIPNPDTVNIDPPLYVLPPSEAIYKSEVPRSEYLLAASALVSKYNMSATMIKDVLKFSQLGMPENNIGEASFNHLQTVCGFNSDYLKYHLYCDYCKKLFDVDAEIDNCQTPGCTGSKTTTRQSYFVTGKFDLQLKEILEREGMWDSMEETRHASIGKSSISDIRSGQGYKKLQEKGQFLDGTHNITLSMFIDGIPLYKSSSVSLWPVYLLINEIPPKKRFRKKNMLLWGVWQGVGKPNMNMFLRPLVMDLWELYTVGVPVSIPSKDLTKEIVCVKALLVVATMDLQARAYVSNMTQHNGLNGCLYCMESGQMVPSGKAYCRAYLQRNQHPVLRTDEMARTSAIQARQTGTRVDGFLGESVLWYLPHFSMTNNVVIDYMHGILLGITKKLLDYWFDPKYTKELYSIKKFITNIDNVLRQIQPLYVIKRLPRVLSNTYHHWKASELRNWLLFYSLPCLMDHLPNVYLVHFSCLVEATYILLTEGISEEELQRAELLLQAFVKTTQEIYGQNAMSQNVHNLTHLVNFVRQWGPLWAWSCFSFESFNGEVKRSVHGTGNVCKQIFWALQSEKHVEARYLNATSPKVQEFLQGMLDHHSEEFSRSAEAFKCSIVKSSNTTVQLQKDVEESLKSQTNRDCELVNVSKIARNGFQMFSKSCTRVRKQNSFTIKLEMPLEGNADIIEVSKYIMEKETRKVFAIGPLMKSSGSILQRRAPHLQKIELIGNKHHVVAAENLREPMMVVKVGTSVFASTLPNNMERD